MDVAQVSARLQDCYESLSPQLRQAARYLLAHPEEVALTSMRRIANHAGVKPSTMVRLARAIGFDGFKEMREPYLRWLRGGEGAYEARARSLRERGAGGAEDLAREMIAADMAALRQLNTPAAAEALTAAAEALIAARHVYVLGLRSCFGLAHYFHYTFGMVAQDCRLIDGSGGTFLETLRGIGPGDVMLAISFRPYSADTVKAVEIAVEAGAAVVAVTDSPVSPIARPARHTMIADTTSPNFFHSLVGPLALVEQLVATAVCKIGDEGLSALKEAERRLKHFDAYWEEPRRRSHGPA